MTEQNTAPRRSLGLDDLLRLLVQNGGSDLHLACGSPPRYRIDGELLQIPGFPKVDENWLLAQIREKAGETAFEKYMRERELDLAVSVEGYGRFRFNSFWQRGLPGGVLRAIPDKIKTLDELGMAPILKELTTKPKGLILVTGPTGSGKSTTLAGMIDYRNENFHDSIMTIEDPIEFVYENKKSLVNQRELGRDTLSFAQGLKHVLRQDPDVILIGEMRDPETISTALTAAETGHLVFGTLHTQSASKSISRIVDSFDSSQQNQVRTQLSDTLQAIISQTLVKRIGGGRVASTEILVNTPAIANNIRRGNADAIYSDIQTGKKFGMHTSDQDLARLVGAGLVNKEDVRALLKDKTALDQIFVKSDDQDWSE